MELKISEIASPNYLYFSDKLYRYDYLGVVFSYFTDIPRPSLEDGDKTTSLY